MASADSGVYVPYLRACPFPTLTAWPRIWNPPSCASLREIHSPLSQSDSSTQVQIQVSQANCRLSSITQERKRPQSGQVIYFAPSLLDRFRFRRRIGGGHNREKHRLESYAPTVACLKIVFALSAGASGTPRLASAGAHMARPRTPRTFFILSCCARTNSSWHAVRRQLPSKDILTTYLSCVSPD